MSNRDSDTFVCDKCLKTYPMYVDGKLNCASAGHFDGLSFHVCYKCYGTPSTNEIIESVDLWMMPTKESPNDV